MWRISKGFSFTVQNKCDDEQMTKTRFASVVNISRTEGKIRADVFLCFCPHCIHCISLLHCLSSLSAVLPVC